MVVLKKYKNMENTVKMNEDNFRTSVVRNELRLKLLKTISSFKSNEVENYKLTNNDILYVLSSMIVRRVE